VTEMKRQKEISKEEKDQQDSEVYNLHKRPEDTVTSEDSLLQLEQQ